MSREQMKARLEAATPGPWVQYSHTTDVVDADGCFVSTRGATGEFIAHAPTDLAKLHSALDAVEALPHEDYCCTKGCPGFGLATCGKVFKDGDECDGSECSCFMSGPLRAIRDALGEDA